MVARWQATCMKVINHNINDATMRDGAMTIVSRSQNRGGSYVGVRERKREGCGSQPSLSRVS